MTRARTRKRPESLEPKLFRHALPTLFTAPNRAVAQKRLGDERRKWLVRQVLSLSELDFTDNWPRLRRILDDPERPSAPVEEWERTEQRRVA